MSSASVVELELASHTPLPVSVSDLSLYAQPIFEARLDNALELQEFSENRTEHRARLPGESDQSISSTNVSSLPPVDKGRKAWQFVRTIPGFVSLYAGVSNWLIKAVRSIHCPSCYLGPPELLRNATQCIPSRQVLRVPAARLFTSPSNWNSILWNYLLLRFDKSSTYLVRSRH